MPKAAHFIVCSERAAMHPQPGDPKTQCGHPRVEGRDAEGLNGGETGGCNILAYLG